jgi:hypothetical protein
MRAIDFHIAVGADHQNSCATQITRQLEQQVERAAVGVMQVFELAAILFGVARSWRRDLESLAQHGNNANEVSRARAQLNLQGLEVEPMQVGSE